MSSASSQSSECGVSSSTPASGVGLSSTGKDYGGLDFKIIVDSKTGPGVTLLLVAPTMQEKAAWTSDISQVSVSVYI